MPARSHYSTTATVASQHHTVATKQRRLAWVMPLFTLLIFLGATMALLWILFWHEAELQRNNLLRDVQSMEVTLTRELLADQQFADRLAFELSLRSDGDAYFLQRSEEYLRQRPAIALFAWTSTESRTRAHAPRSRSVIDMRRERPSVEEVNRMLRLTAAMERATYTAIYRDYRHQSYIEYHTPVFDRDRFAGTISLTYPLQSVAQHLIPRQFLDKYRVSIEDADATSRREQGDGIAEPLTQSVAVTLPWRDVRLTASSLKTDSLLTQRVLAVVTMVMAGCIVWSLLALRSNVSRSDAADRALVASHERFETVTDALDAAVYVADFECGEVLFANETCRHVFPGVRLGAPIVEVEAGFDPKPSTVFASDTLVDADGKYLGVRKGEFHDRAQNRWYLLRAKSIQWVDGRTARMHMASDITERKHADAVSRQQQETLLLTSRLLTVGEMASTLAHEINQPLAAIANYNRGCVRRLQSGLWQIDEITATLEKASVQAERAGQVIQRVRAFLRNREPARSSHDVNEILNGVAKLIELQAEQAGVALTLSLHQDLGPVLIDRIMVEQVVLNLVKNGIDAMVDTHASQRALVMTTAPASDDRVEVAVSDHGHGIAEEVEMELFAPFFTTKRDGMGMGLNICRSIIELHEGRLWFTRNASRGSTFRFTLPLVAR